MANLTRPITLPITFPLTQPVTGAWRRSSTPGFSLTAQTIAEDADLGDVIGTFTPSNLGALTVSSYAIIADPDGKFDIDGDDLLVDGALDYETDEFHSVTVRMTLSDASTVDRVFSIAVTDVVEVIDPFVANMNMAEIRNVVYAAATH